MPQNADLNININSNNLLMHDDFQRFRGNFLPDFNLLAKKNENKNVIATICWVKGTES